MNRLAGRQPTLIACFEECVNEVSLLPRKGGGVDGCVADLWLGKGQAVFAAALNVSDMTKEENWDGVGVLLN
ncbi:hypothetical protein E2C01_082497 [Portunus trituberculatus]|uniref:Uncharacterized protein n=1 Tax=Portunus trituberculatus TaxID=210409 RepID=A0A5B7J1V1_PORTR|nr:hypothetical protein [Portunus trituberculatus]